MNLLMLAQQAMNNPTWVALRDSMRKEGEYTRQGHMRGFWMVLAGIAVLVVIIAVLRNLRPVKTRVLAAAPRRLFQQAAKSLGIGAVNRFLLLRAAYAGRLEHPAVMLITPELMETHAGEWADHYPIASLRRFLRSRVNQVAVSLFGSGDTHAVVG